MEVPTGNIEDKHIEMWKVKKLIKSLTAARGNGTSMISLVIPPKDQISRVAKMLADEYGTASNIKSRVNRQSVLDAITSTLCMQLLLDNFNPATLEGLMCTSLVSVGYDGSLYSCDFNYALDVGLSRSVFEIDSLDALISTPVTTSNHCFGCTAGMGSS